MTCSAASTRCIDHKGGCISSRCLQRRIHAGPAWNWTQRSPRSKNKNIHHTPPPDQRQLTSLPPPFTPLARPRQLPTAQLPSRPTLGPPFDTHLTCPFAHSFSNGTTIKANTHRRLSGPSPGTGQGPSQATCGHQICNDMRNPSASNCMCECNWGLADFKVLGTVFPRPVRRVEGQAR